MLHAHAHAAHTNKQTNRRSGQTNKQMNARRARQAKAIDEVRAGAAGAGGKGEGSRTHLQAVREACTCSHTHTHTHWHADKRQQMAPDCTERQHWQHKKRRNQFPSFSLLLPLPPPLSPASLPSLCSPCATHRLPLPLSICVVSPRQQHFAAIKIKLRFRARCRPNVSGNFGNFSIFYD